jgi:tetratricopeptide (TPR) repeat protein
VRIFRKTTLLILFIFAALALPAGWFALQFYRSEKQKRLRANASEAMGKAAYKQAAFWATAALNDRPNGIDENRLMADVADAVKSPSVLAWRERVAELDPKTLANYLTWARSALEMNESAIAWQALTRAPSSANSNVGWQRLSAAVAAALNKPDEAEIHFEQAASLEPQNPQNQVNLQSFRLFSTDTNKAQMAREWLEGHLENQVTRVLVGRALLQDALRRNDLDAGRRYKAVLESESRSEIGDRLNCVEIDYRSNDFAAGLKRVEDYARERSEDAAAVLYWMNSHGMGAEGLAWIESAFPSDQRPISLQIAVADVYSAQGAWGQLQQHLRNGDWRGLDFIREAMLIRAARAQSDPDWASAWSHLVNRLSKDYGRLIIVGRLAQTWGWQDEACDLFWEVVDGSAPQQTEALQRLFDIYRQEKNTAGLLRVAKQQLELYPDNFAFRNNYAYLALLLNVDLSRARELAEKNAELAPVQPNVVATIALSCLRAGKVSEARQRLERLPAEQLSDPNIALHYGAALAATRDYDHALRYAKLALRSDQLLPEEKAIAEGAIGRNGAE